MEKSLLLVVLCAFLCAFCPAKAQWSAPSPLTDSSTDSTFPQMYIDPLTKITHLLWIEERSDVFSLAYVKIYYNQTRSKPIYLETDHRPRLSHIIGEGNGRHLLVAYDAKRVQGDNNDCTEEDRTGCYEIYFTESKDNGDTWSKPLMIQHDNPDEAVTRKGPRMVYVSDNRQVFLTYWRDGPMAYTTRIGDSNTFAKETVFPFSKTTAYQSVAHTTNERHQSVIHFIYVNWTFPEENMMYTQSVDLGKSWTTPKRLVFYKHESTSDSFFRPFTVADETILKNAIHVGFVLNDKVFFIRSLDNGITWANPHATHSSPAIAIAPRIQLCRSLKGQMPKVYILYAQQKVEKTSYYVFGSVDLRTYAYTDESVPFSGLNFNWDYMLDCFEDGNRVTISAVVESDKEGKNSIYLSNFTPK